MPDECESEDSKLEDDAKLAALLVLIDEGDACDPADDIDGEECMERLRKRIADREQERKARLGL
jgi:hypothetical protein